MMVLPKNEGDVITFKRCGRAILIAMNNDVGTLLNAASPSRPLLLVIMMIRPTIIQGTCTVTHAVCSTVPGSYLTAQYLYRYDTHMIQQEK